MAVPTAIPGAATVFMALQLGTPDVLPDDAVAKLHDRYMNVYGQR